MSIKPILILTTALLCGQLNAQGIDPLELVPDRSRVLWTATKVTGEHTGGVPVASGTMEVADGELIGANVTMDMSALTCIDIESPETNAKLVRHLKSDDFFAVEAHPTASFKTTSVEAIPGAGKGKPNYRITGELTIKGATHPITFDCIFWMDGSSGRAAANFTFDRSKYDIQYRSASFFSDLGDKAISDTVSLTFDITAQ
jgi:polyisoprenoid-binding protein YceI